MFGARAAREEVLGARPDADVAIAVVWIPMVHGDAEEEARRSASLVDERRVRQFYDPERRAGRAVATGMGGGGGAGDVAWDMYLLYEPGARWEDGPPRPVAWVHQISATWADQARRHHGEALVQALREMGATLPARLAGPAGPAGPAHPAPRAR